MVSMGAKCRSRSLVVKITASYYPLKRFKRAPWTVSEKGAGTVSGIVNSG
jgi:hypothetical protein